MAMISASIVELAPSLAKTASREALTSSMGTPSSSATCLLERPSTISSRTRRSSGSSLGQATPHASRMAHRAFVRQRDVEDASEAGSDDDGLGADSIDPSG